MNNNKSNQQWYMQPLSIRRQAPGIGLPNQFSKAPPVLPTLPRGKHSDLTQALYIHHLCLCQSSICQPHLSQHNYAGTCAAPTCCTYGFHKRVGGYQTPWQIKRQLLVIPRGAHAGAPQGCILPPLWHVCALQLLHKDFTFLWTMRCVKIN